VCKLASLPSRIGAGLGGAYIGPAVEERIIVFQIRFRDEFGPTVTRYELLGHVSQAQYRSQCELGMLPFSDGRLLIASGPQHIDADALDIGRRNLSGGESPLGRGKRYPEKFRRFMRNAHALLGK
jgi:hypothetical protein